MSLRVTWVGGSWFLKMGQDRHRVEGDGRWLDAWLAGRGLSRADLDFGGSRALEQRFVSELGPIDGR
jgi:hypothetical protein